MKHESNTAPEKRPSEATRRAYAKPRLARFGTLVEVTKNVESEGLNSDGVFLLKTS